MSTAINRELDGTFLSRYLCQTIANTLPRRVKRQIYVSSVLGVVIQNRYPDPTLLEPLNDTLKLANQSTGLLLWVYLYNLLWKAHCDASVLLSMGRVQLHSLKLRELSDMDLWKIAAYFARNVKGCFQYGSHELLTSDIHDMLAVLRILPCDRGNCLQCGDCYRPKPGASDPDLLSALKQDHRKPLS